MDHSQRAEMKKEHAEATRALGIASRRLRYLQARKVSAEKRKDFTELEYAKGQISVTDQEIGKIERTLRELEEQAVGSWETQ